MLEQKQYTMQELEQLQKILEQEHKRVVLKVLLLKIKNKQ